MHRKQAQRCLATLKQAGLIQGGPGELAGNLDVAAPGSVDFAIQFADVGLAT